MRKKKPNLKLNTTIDASVNKENKDESDSERPSTATLEKPQILDIKFIRKIDMSLIKKEFLSITNLCRVPLTVIKVFDKTGTCERPLSLPSTSDKSCTDKSSKRSKTSLSTCDNDKQRPTTSETNLKKINPSRSTSVCKGFIKKTCNDTNNNEKLAKIDKTKLVSKNQKLIKLPEPCTTCGRPEQPERFHSHPVGSIKPTKKMSEPQRVPVKSTVQKPIAMKYKSKLNNECKKENNNKEETTTRSSRPVSNRGPKTLMCYVCGREFGTASLPLHEPKCLEKWHRENAILPPSQRRKIPAKPEVPMSSEQWNQYAWQSCQASLVPCDNCGRTFLPDRLIVHQRSCKNNNDLVSNSVIYFEL
ncbi:hypothetical protein FQR65_LT05859 [Abscondita terminalis]|nr:hypothetical protein FQR65_LT05859 [Abscondita terminalis]